MTVFAETKSAFERPDKKKSFQHVEISILAGFLVLIWIVGSVSSSAFLGADNIQTIIRSASLVGIVAIGLSLIMIAGHQFSLSIEQTAAMSAVALGILISHGTPILIAVAMVLVLSLVIGFGEGYAVAHGGNPILVTLGSGSILFGLAGVLTGGQGIGIAGLLSGVSGDIGGISVPSWAFLIAIILAAVFLGRSRLGIKLRLTGANRATARAVGFNVKGTAVVAFMLSALGACIVAILTTAQFDRAALDQFQGLTFDALAAVLVAGTSLKGGDGSAGRTALGAIFIATLGNVMALHGMDFGARLTIQGIVIGVAVVLFHLIRRRREKH